MGSVTKPSSSLLCCGAVTQSRTLTAQRRRHLLWLMVPIHDWLAPRQQQNGRGPGGGEGAERNRAADLGMNIHLPHHRDPLPTGPCLPKFSLATKEDSAPQDQITSPMHKNLGNILVLKLNTSLSKILKKDVRIKS